eukprot:COSAG01_NODE_985_length_12329_cov_363.217171_1_plen_67_part_10
MSERTAGQAGPASPDLCVNITIEYSCTTQLSVEYIRGSSGYPTGNWLHCDGYCLFCRCRHCWAPDLP